MILNRPVGLKSIMLYLTRGLLSLLCFVAVSATNAGAELQMSSTGFDRMTLSWTAPGDDSTSGRAAQYDIRYSTSSIDVGNWDQATQVSGEPLPQPAGSTETFVVTNLQPSTVYYFAVKTSDEVPNWSGLSNVVSDTTPAMPPLDSLLNLSSQPGNGQGRIFIGWDAPGGTTATDSATSYVIKYALFPINSSNWSSINSVPNPPIPAAMGTTQSDTVTGLNPGEVYHVAIKAFDINGDSSQIHSFPSSFTSGIASPQPTTTLIDVGASTATVTCSTVTSYKSITYNFIVDTVYTFDSVYNFPSAISATALVTGGLATASFGSLASGVTYFWSCRAMAVDLSDSSKWSAPISFALGVDSVGPTISNVSESNITDTSATIVWTTSEPSLSQVQFGTDTSYGSTTNQTASLDTTHSHTLSNLSAGTTYHYRLRSVDSVGNVTLSADFTLTTSAVGAAAAPETYAYPSPFEIGVHPYATFTNVPAGVTLTLTTATTGELIRRWTNTTGNDLLWDGSNESGNTVASGIYTWYIEETGSHGKLMVIR